MFMKTNVSGEVVERPNLLIKKEELDDPDKGLARLRALGWNVGDASELNISGQVVTKK